MNFRAVLVLPKTAGSAQTHKSMSFIWIVWSTLYVYLWSIAKSYLVLSSRVWNWIQVWIILVKWIFWNGKLSNSQITRFWISMLSNLRDFNQTHDLIMNAGWTFSSKDSSSPLEAVHKLCRLKGGGGWVKNCQFYLLKRRLRGGEGFKNCPFWDEIVYGRPP